MVTHLRPLVRVTANDIENIIGIHNKLENRGSIGIGR